MEPLQITAAPTFDFSAQAKQQTYTVRLGVGGRVYDPLVKIRITLTP